MAGRTETRTCRQCQKQFQFEIWRLKQEKNPGQFCSRACKASSQCVDLADRFYANLSEPLKSGCVQWTGTQNDDLGYGRIQTGDGSRKMIYAHRLAWELTHGPIPDGMFVCHACDNPRCVNVSHLFLGQPKDNSEDMRKKARQARGERQHSAKLTDNSVREIRRLHGVGGMTHKNIAALYGVTPGAIRRVVCGLTWKHVTAQ